MKKYIFIVIAFLLWNTLGVVFGDSSILFDAQKSEILAIITEKKTELARAEAQIDYLKGRIDQDRDIQLSDLEGSCADVILLSETVSADIESLLEDTKVFLGMEYFTIPAERSALDSSRIQRARNMHDRLNHAYALWKNTDAKTPEEKEELLENMITTSEIGQNLTNRVLKIIEKSLEQSATDENPEPKTLSDFRSTYREFRNLIAEDLGSLNELSEAIEAQDNETQIEKKYTADILSAELLKHTAYSQLKKAERMLAELEKNGTIELENL